MGAESPNVILYDVNGQEMSVSNGAAIPAGTSALMIAGSDGTNSRFITLDGSGRQLVVGAGIAGTPAGGVVSIQGVTSGTNLPVSQATAANLNATVAQGAGSGSAATYWYNRITDGTNTMPTGDALARAIFHQITDSTNGPVNVKAASTAPIAADKALVVVLSPNQQAIPVSTSPASSIPTLAFGDITLSSNANTVQINRTTYTEQTVNFTGSVKSSSAADAAAGTGARTLTIYYVDQTGATSATETVTFNGTTAVNLVNTNHCFIEKMIVQTVGSGGVNAGTISLFTGAGGTGTTVGTIGVGDNRTQWCHHYVVTGKTCNVTNVSHSNTSSVSGGTSTSHIRALSIGVANAAEIQVSEFIDVGGAQNPSLKAYGSTIQVIGPARLAMYVLPASNTSTIYRASIDCYDL